MRLRWLLLCIVMISACSAERNQLPGPRLLQEVTLAPTTPAPTRALSPTPSAIVIPVLTAELVSPLEVVTIGADVQLVTPTLPPTRTPSPTATITNTPIPSPTPTATSPYQVVVVPPPTPLVSNAQPVGIASPVVPVVSGCGMTWFFPPAYAGNSCPPNAPAASSGAYQQFQRGYMVWISQLDAIYVLYDSAESPRWQVFADTFEDNMPEIDPALNNAPPNTWQPRRGIGLVWRGQPGVRDRLGWAIMEHEWPYTVQVQTGSDGMIYLGDSNGGVFALQPGGLDWKHYSS
jgi:hypothetical protein